ncbi:hypothetical protein [Sutcliffiella horikoshii]|uniref:hypothetical protein n=1 Tax=Sutcliffiella horikoshii TaxID=79883 RepID=UPI001F48BE44|nr:hypothetical protein [Sutcliffiella horikoshii]MCG1020771.1 hypothetical protein [Sutcliffiella horikoshii]
MESSNLLNKLILFTALIFILLPNSTTLAQTTPRENFITEEELNRILTENQNDNLTKEELNQILSENQNSNLSKEDLTDMLIKNKDLLLESREEKIGLLEGNISSILALFGIIIAVLTVLFTIFGLILRKSFTDKLKDVKEIQAEIEINKKEVNSNVTDAKVINEQLKTAIIQMNDSNKNLDNKAKLLEDETKNIKKLQAYLYRLELYTKLHVNNLKLINNFHKQNLYIQSICKEVEELLEKEFKNNSIPDTVTDRTQYLEKEDEQTYQKYFKRKYEYYHSNLNNYEKEMIKTYDTLFESSNHIFLDTQFDTSQLQSIYSEWKGHFDEVKYIHRELKAVHNIN